MHPDLHSRPIFGRVFLPISETGFFYQNTALDPLTNQKPGFLGLDAPHLHDLR
jgi:hypothetical protein